MSDGQPVVVDGRGLTLDAIARVARNGTRVELTGDPGLRASIDAGRWLRDDMIARGVPIYGITTGFGDSVRSQIGPERAARLQDNLLRFLGAGTGATMAVDAARAVLLIRANTLARGHSAVRMELIQRMLDLLNEGITPVIPEEGSVGASGDLVPLSYLAAVLTGERAVHRDGGVVPAADALANAGIEPLRLEPKEGLALVNGTSFMTALAVLATVDARRIALLSDVCTAMTTEVLLGIAGPFHRFVHDIAKPHPGQIRSATHVRELLRDSRLVFSYEEVIERAGTLEEGHTQLEVQIQNPYSVRCASQFTGVLWDVLAWVADWLVIEANSTNDNPLFDIASDTVFSGGNFAGGHVALAMDALKAAVASVGDLMDRQMELVVDEKFNNGLTSNLIPILPGGHPDEGVNHGFKGMQLACSSLAADALSRCMPLSAFSRSTECHNQDKVSMGATAARSARDVVALVEKVGAIHLLALCQAADLREPERLGATRVVYDRVRAEVSPLEGDRAMDRDILAVLDMLHDGSLLDGVAGWSAPVRVTAPGS